MPSCFVYRCNSGNNWSDKSTQLFRIPKSLGIDEERKWLSVLNKTDKKFDKKNKNHRICHLHFEDKYLVKEDCTQIGTETVSLPRQCWMLTHDAIPTIFPTIPKNPKHQSP